MKRHTYILVYTALLITSLFTQPAQAVIGNAIETDNYSRINVSFELLSPTGAVETLNLNGSAEINVFFEGPEGVALDNDRNGYDEVSTEMVSLDLTGTSSFSGPISLSINSSRSSTGLIEERVNNTPGKLDLPPFTTSGVSGTADSFFDIFITINIGSIALFNLDPMRIAGVITHKPATPGEFENMFRGPLVALYDANGNPTGYGLAGVPPVPEPATYGLMALGLAMLGFIRRRRK